MALRIVFFPRVWPARRDGGVRHS